MLIGLSIAAVPALAQDHEGQERWRLSQNDDRIGLYIAETDLGTDFFGSPSFSCKRGENRINIDARMDEHEREAFAELIRKGEYPRIDLVPSEPDRVSTLPSLSYSEMDGWHYTFEIAADAQALALFSKTGVFEYKIGEFDIRTEFNVGLENVTRFLKLCGPEW